MLATGLGIALPSVVTIGILLYLLLRERKNLRRAVKQLQVQRHETTHKRLISSRKQLDSFPLSDYEQFNEESGVKGQHNRSRSMGQQSMSRSKGQHNKIFKPPQIYPVYTTVDYSNASWTETDLEHVTMPTRTAHPQQHVTMPTRTSYPQQLEEENEYDNVFSSNRQISFV